MQATPRICQKLVEYILIFSLVFTSITFLLLFTLFVLLFYVFVCYCFYWYCLLFCFNVLVLNSPVLVCVLFFFSILFSLLLLCSFTYPLYLTSCAHVLPDFCYFFSRLLSPFLFHCFLPNLFVYCLSACSNGKSNPTQLSFIDTTFSALVLYFVWPFVLKLLSLPPPIFVIYSFTLFSNSFTHSLALFLSTSFIFFCFW